MTVLFLKGANMPRVSAGSGDRSALPCVIALLCACVLAFSAAVQSDASPERPNGLLWNRTGLPATFPLDVKSAPGQDYYMVLRDAKSGTEALAAYVRGGEFFRVLVPPGTFAVAFAAGETWQGEEALFGSGRTFQFEVTEPLTFAIVDDTTKLGHSIDLREMLQDGVVDISVSDRFICQTIGPGVAPPRLQGADAPAERPAVGADIQRRNFLRGDNAYVIYDRARQQERFDPPVLGAPRVPLALPEPRGAQQQKRSAGTMLNDRPTVRRRYELREYLCDPPHGSQ
jgi:hypothetical protein